MGESRPERSIEFWKWGKPAEPPSKNRINKRRTREPGLVLCTSRGQGRLSYNNSNVRKGCGSGCRDSFLSLSPSQISKKRDKRKKPWARVLLALPPMYVPIRNI
jgi:hypothetical protein